jgi:hypothetical protein
MKTRKRSLTQQFNYAVTDSYHPGADKHSIKASSKTGKPIVDDTHIVFSIRAKKDLCDLAAQAARFIKENHPDIQYVRDVRVEHFVEFLESKAAICSTATLNQYGTKIRKLARCVNHRFNLNVDWSTSLRVPTSEKTPDGKRQRTQQMKRADLDKLITYARDPGKSTNAVVAWELTARLGLRVQGAADIRVSNIHLDRPGRWGYGQADIVEKGGRHRNIDVLTADDRSFLEKLIEGKEPNTKLIGIKAGSINKALNRAMHALELKSEYPSTSEHAIRKLYAQTCWNLVRARGMDVKNAKAYVNAQLGHSRIRDDKLLRIYVSDMS